MPIANVVTAETMKDLEVDGLADAWSKECGVDAKHMTINVISADRQVGAGFRLMAFLLLPSLWSAQQVRELQLGLASALSRCSGVPVSDIQIVTAIISSGHVVEGGEVQEW